MKFKVTMKRPDVLDEAISDAVETITVDGLDAEELEMIRDERKAKIRNLCLRWFEYAEYLTVEVDTEAETCTVVPAKN